MGRLSTTECTYLPTYLGACACSRIPSGDASRAGLRSLLGIRGGVAWGGRAPAGPGYSDGCVGVGPLLPVAVGSPGGLRSRPSTSSGLQRTSCRGKQGDGVSTVSRGGVRLGGWCIWVVACLLCCTPRPMVPGAWYDVLCGPGALGRSSGREIVVVSCPASLVVAGYW